MKKKTILVAIMTSFLLLSYGTKADEVSNTSESSDNTYITSSTSSSHDENAVPSVSQEQQETVEYDGTTEVTSNTSEVISQERSEVSTNAVDNIENKEYVSDGDTSEAKKAIAVKTPSINYSTHVQSEGWMDFVKDGQMSGTSGRALRLEGIKIKLSNLDGISGGVEYSTHIQSIGWDSAVRDGQLSGTTGRSLRLEAIKINLTGNIKNVYDIYYRVHIQSKGWLNWAKNGESAGSSGAAKRLEGIEIRLVKKGDKAPSGSGKSFLSGDEAKLPEEIKPNVNYSTHIQSYGWQEYKSNGQLSGTTGEALRLEAIRINLDNLKIGGGIEYTTHVQSYGWQNFVKNNALSGTAGQALRLEGIKIRLTGEVSKYYDVYYRVHIQSKGWLNWAKNGESAGSSGAAKRLESIQIVIESKKENGPSGSGKSFLVGDEARTDDEIEEEQINKRLSMKPVYFSQLDGRWANTYVGNSTVGAAGCVPTSLSMVLRGSYGYNVMPMDVINVMYSITGFNKNYSGSSATDLAKAVRYYGRTMKVVNSNSEMNNYLAKGYPVILFQNVGIGHAIVVHGYSNGRTNTYDPYGQKFYSGWVSTSYLWQSPSLDSIDWSEGTPRFVIM